MLGAAGASQSFDDTCEYGASVNLTRASADEGPMTATVAVQSIDAGTGARSYTIFAGCFAGDDTAKRVKLLEKNDD